MSGCRLVVSLRIKRSCKKDEKMTHKEKHILEDGSFTLIEPTLQEAYHNRAGAFAEADFHYALPSLQHLEARPHPPDDLVIWDVCFGLGYNCFAFLQRLLSSEGLKSVKRITIYTVDLDASLSQYWQAVLDQTHFETLRQAYRIPTTLTADALWQWEHLASDLPELTWHLHFDDALNVLPQWEAQQNTPVDVIFHDAFSPAKVPHLWSTELFALYSRVLHPCAGCVLTYSLARRVKTAVESAGLHWRKLPRLGGKDGALFIFKG